MSPRELRSIRLIALDGRVLRSLSIRSTSADLDLNGIPAGIYVLAAELVKSGWTRAELELFADPKGATRTTSERYCQMMQDFFAAHLGIADPSAQDRLLHKTLKLVVGG